MSVVGFYALRGAELQLFLRGALRQVCTNREGTCGDDCARRGTSILVRLQLPNSGPRPASPISPRTDRTLQGSESTLRKRSKQPYQPPDPPRGRTQTNPLMAGRRRRTPAAALRWPRCRCRCRSSSRSTCAGIECHSSPPRSTRRRPRARLCSMAWNFRKGPRTDFQEIMFEFHTAVRYKSRPPVGASGSNSIFGAV